MFDALTGRLDAVFRKLRQRGKLHPKQVDNALADMRTALIEADASVEVVDDFLSRVRTRALGDEVMRSLTPAQQVVKVVRDELTQTLGGEHKAFQLPGANPAVVMMAGVQGSGKTTACAKLALHLKEKGKQPMLVAADLQRPGAIEQLFTLGDEIGVPVVSDGKNAERVAKNASRPHHVLMSCDAMTGQDAVVQARAFMREVDTTGFVLTKLDGDARGGAALSITAITGRPVFFAGVGEKPSDLEPFYPDRMASRILGMGDVLTLIDKAQESMDAEKAAEAAERMMQARFTLEDFLVQMREMKKLGPIEDLLAMLPGVPGGKNALKDLQVDQGQMARAEAIISSMTREERANPAIIGGSRRLRIARGSGTTTADVNALLKEFEQARKMMKAMMGGKGMPRVPGMPRIPGIS